MNKKRRNSINKQYELLRSIIENIETLRDEEQDAFDNMPESLQDTDRGDEMNDAIDALTDTIDSLEEAMSRLEDIL